MRDLDLLCQINERTKAVVQMTLTTYDDKLCRILASVEDPLKLLVP